MKLGIKVGDKVKVLTGKFAGKEDTVSSVDKKRNRIRLSNLKKSKAKDGKQNHGTFHVLSLKPVSLAALESAPETASQG